MILNCQEITAEMKNCERLKKCQARFLSVLGYILNTLASNLEQIT